MAVPSGHSFLGRQVKRARGPEIDRDLVFTRLDGQPLNPRALSQAFQVRRKNAGLPHVRLHDLRHGAATLALEGDVNLELIRRRMGHAHISTTIEKERAPQT